jgi:hypothetical protein
MATELRKWMLDFPGGRYRSSSELLTETFGTSPNIEDLITALESEIKALKNGNDKDKSRRMRLGFCRGKLCEALRDWFREIHLNPAPSYARFADTIVKAGDVVLTFNYDDSRERELKRSCMWDVSRGYGFPLGTDERSSEVLVLKLHGSIN